MRDPAVLEVRAQGSLRWPLSAFGIGAAIFAVWAVIADRVLARPADLDPTSIVTYSGDAVLGGRARWDAYWYADIANHGYAFRPGQGQQSPAFFPGYPFAMRVLGRVVGDPVLAGIVLTLAAGAVATVLIYRWTVRRRGERVARYTVLALLLYPYSFYLFGTVYADPLFLALAIAAFYVLDDGHPVWAGLLAAGASATRLVGIIVVIGLVLRTLEMRGVFDARSPDASSSSPGVVRTRLARLHAADAGVLLGFGGIVGYCVLLAAQFGKPLLFQEAGTYWGQGEGIRTVLKVRTYEFLRDAPVDVKLLLVLQLCLFVGALALTPAVFRRFGWAYGTYSVLILGFPLLTVGNLHGAGRYVFGAFPVFAVVADLLSKPGRSRARARAAIISGALVFMTATFYIRGQWVS